MANNNKVCCLNCKREFTISAFGMHKNAKTCVLGAIVVDGSIRKSILEPVPTTLECPYCDKLCKNKNSYRNHVRTCPKNSERDYKNGMSGKKAWNKDLTKDTDDRIKKSGEAYSLKYQAGLITKKCFSPETLKKFSDLAISRKLGGPRPIKKKGIKHNGIWLDSTWELKVAQSLDENNILWERPRTGFVWSDNGNKYYPDFYLSEFDVYLDPKNPYLRIMDKLKIEEAQKRNNITVLVLSEDQLTWDTIKTLI